MIIAIPTKNEVVDNHFGHCEYYTLITTNDNKEVIKKERFEAPSGCGCKSGIAVTLKKLGVKVMLAGNMGDGALNVLKQNEISVIRGCSGNIDSVLESYLEGNLSDSGIACASHEDGHTCSHH